MARVAVKRSAWLICNNHLFNSVSPKLTNTLPADPARKTPEIAKLPCFPAYFLMINRGFGSNVKASGCGEIKLGAKGSRELIDLLKSYGFSEVQIEEIIQKFPRVLSLKASRNLKPKLDYLVECGFRGSILHSLIASNPYIFGRSLESFLKPRYRLLKTYLMDKVNMAIRRHFYLLSHSDVETGIECLKKQGVPDSIIRSLLARAPTSLMYTKNRLVKLVEASKALGIKPSSAAFVWHMRTVSSLSEKSLKKKAEVFKSLGWSDEDVRATLLHAPAAFLISEEKLRRNMDFFINNVKAVPGDVIRVPEVLQLSLSGRIIPRNEVMKLLKEHNLWGSFKITTFFRLSEERFMKSCVEKNLEQVPHLLQAYCDSRKAKADNAI